MALNLEGRNALVTGASKGVGKGIALQLARPRCDVAVNYRSDRAGAEATVAKIEALGHRAFPVFADVGSAQDVAAMFDDVLQRFGRLHIHINNAGCATFKSLLELEERDWDRVIATNLKGCFLCTQQAARHMREKGGGRIINIGSEGTEQSRKIASGRVSELLCPRNWPLLRNRATPWRAGRWRWPTQPARSQTAQHGASGRERVADHGMRQDESFTCVRHGGGSR